MEPETALQNKIIVELSKRGCYAENHTVGKFYTEYGGIVHIGVHGQSDIYGHRPDGKAFYVEVKLPGKYPRQDQKQFMKAMRNTGAIAGCAHSVEEAVEVVFGDKCQI